MREEVASHGGTRRPPGPAVAHVALAIEEAGDGISVQDASGALVFVNEAGARLMGFATAEEAMEAPVDGILERFELLDEAGQPLDPSALPSRRALLEPGRHEGIVRFRNGASAGIRDAVVSSISVAGPDGSVEFVVTTFKDVTAVRRLEEQLRLLADVGALVGNAADYQETLNSLARLMVGRMADWCVVDIQEPGGVRRLAVTHQDPEKVRLAQEIQRRYPPDPESGPTAQVIATGVPVLMPALRDADLARLAQDEEHAAALRSLGLRSVLMVPLTARGRSLGALSLIRSDESHPFTEADVPLVQEVGNRAASVVDNVRLLAELTEAVRLRDDFLAVVSHDMRTPLAAILGYVQLATRRAGRLEDGDRRLVEYLGAAERTAERMTELVADLMDVSLLRSGQQLPMRTAPVALRALVAAILDERRKLVRDHHFAAPSDGEEIVVAGDERRLRRVLDNLLDNAVKFSGAGSVIRVEIGGTADHGTISVADEGRGIASDELPFVFERFRRGSNTAGIRGIGLGLTGSRDIMRQMGGDISVSSRLGEGTTFVLTLPRIVAPA